MNMPFTKYHGLSAKEFLSRLRSEEGFSLEPPVDVYEIVDLVGARLSEDVEWDDLSTAGSVSLGKDGAKIWVNPLENRYEPRKRFTIAHEIGHLLLHIDPDIGVKEFLDTKKTLNRKQSYWDSKEYEANNFADQLLMPVSLINEHGNRVIQEAKEGCDDSPALAVEEFVRRMAEVFNVSPTVMRYRLINLGAIKS